MGTILIGSIAVIKILQPSSLLGIGLILGVIGIYFYIQKVLYNMETSNTTLEYKYNSLLIKPNKLLLKYSEIIDFLYNIKNYYEYNLTNYNELIEELNEFFIMYDQLKENNYDQCKYIYDNLNNSKIKLIDTLANYIYSIPDDIYLINNLDQKKIEFNNLLDNYLNNITNNCNINEFKKNKPQPYNLIF
jgi:hypothetical protein